MIRNGLSYAVPTGGIQLFQSLGRAAVALSAVLFLTSLAEHGQAQTRSDYESQQQGFGLGGTQPSEITSTTPRPPTIVTPTVPPGADRIVSPPAGAQPRPPGAEQPEAPSTGTAAAEGRRERNEFQTLVAISTGRELPMFGYDLFRLPPSTFAPVEGIAVPANYVIGPGDEIYIRAWGQVDVDYRTFVDRDGQIYLPKVGAISLAGIRYQDLDSRIRSAIKRVFKNFEMTTTLGQLRSIQVFVVGQAKRPGSYTIGSLSTLVNALFASGGPSKKGSMRRIQLKRDAKVVTEFDIYDLLLHGDKSKDAKLLPGDVIYIPPIGPLAAVSGSVNVPAIYELNGRTSVADLIAMAGGLASTALGQKVTLERIVGRRVRVVEEFTLDDKDSAQALSDGDLLTVYTLSPRIANAVTLKGNVAQVMRFPWREGMRVSDIIPDKDALVVPDYWVSKNIAGMSESWLEPKMGSNAPGQTESWLRERSLERTDETNSRGDLSSGNLSSREDLLKNATKLRAEARTDETKLRGELKRSSAEINWDYAVIERLNVGDLTTMLIPFNLTRAVQERSPSDDLLLMPGDVVTVFSKDEIQVPTAKQTRYVRLEGEFVNSGVYQVRAGETLRGLVVRVGGLTKHAYVFGSEFTRETTRLLQQKQLDDSLDRLEIEAQRLALNRSQGVLNPEDAQALRQQSLAQGSLIAKLRAIKANGRIVLDLPPSEKLTVNDVPNIVLEDGDRYFVPPVPSTVGVFGSVFNPNSYLFQQGKNYGQYLGRAGGPTRDAETGSLYLLRADGSVISKRQSAWSTSIVLMPGDAVIVPETLERFNWTKELKDWTQILYQLALGVAGLAVLHSF